MPRDHELKINTPYYNAVRQGIKTAEIRLNDRDFQRGDKMILSEVDDYGKPLLGHPIVCEITHVLSDNEYFKDDYVMLSFKILGLKAELIAD